MSSGRAKEDEELNTWEEECKKDSVECESGVSTALRKPMKILDRSGPQTTKWDTSVRHRFGHFWSRRDFGGALGN